MREKKREKEKPALPPVEGRLPPHDLDAERDVLATFFAVPKTFQRAKAKLTVPVFFGEAHQLVYQAMLDVTAQGQPIDLNTVRSAMKAAGTLERAGGTLYLGDLTSARPTVDNIDSYVDTLLTKHRAREFQNWCRVADAETHDTAAFNTLLKEKHRELSRIAYSGGTTAQLHHIGPVVEASMAGAKNRRRGRIPSGIPTGYAGLDALTGGIGFGDLWVVAGRPGAGKSSLLFGMAANISAPVLEEAPIWIPRYGFALFELEMQEVQVPDRIICMRSGIDLARWRSGKLSEEDMVEAGVHASALRQSHLWIDDSPANSLTIEDVEAKVLALKAEWDIPATFAGCPLCNRNYVYSAELDRWYCEVHAPDPRAADVANRLVEERVQLTREQLLAGVAVDHIGLTASAEAEHSREREIAKVTGGLKAMAKRLHVGAIAISQMNREVDRREGKQKKPQMSDLRDSGSVEQDADTIVFPFRPGFYKPEDYKIQGEAEFIVPKQRNGPPGTIPMKWVSKCSRFDDVASSYGAEPLPEGL